MKTMMLHKMRFIIGKNILIFSFLFATMIIGFSNSLSAQACLNPGDAHNTPCTACLYDFGGGAGNVVPCGPSANTTSSVPINHGNGDGLFMVPSGCGTLCPAPDNDVLWVSFYINAGGSFEWQTVAGSDKFHWVMYYSSNQPPDDGTSNTNDTNDCGNIVYYKCGTQFTGWEIESTPDPTKTWRYYIAYFFQASDSDKIADGVVKIRKSCGLACAEPVATIATASETCIETGSLPTPVTLSPGTTGTSYFWSATPADPTLVGQYQDENPTVNPMVTTTYFVNVVGSDGCSQSVGEITIEVNASCFECMADAGTISGLSQNENICLGESSLDLISFNTDADPQAAGYSNAFFLVNDTGSISNIVSGTSTSFLFSGLAEGVYRIYGLSYLDSQAAVDAADYLSGFATLTALEADILPTGGTCAEIAVHNFQVSIVDPSCGTFPQN